MTGNRQAALHVGDQGEIETTIPQHREGDVDFTVVQMLEYFFQMQHHYSVSRPT